MLVLYRGVRFPSQSPVSPGTVGRMGDPATNRLYHDPDLARFYDLKNRWDADFDTCSAMARDAASVLDLGCGTGELAAALGRGRSVTGVDPAAAMLAIAGSRPGGADVIWVEADARSVRLGRRFDLIVLTGHAFQVFLTDDDQRAVLATIAAHLSPSGRFVFDSRNPAFPGSKTRVPDETRYRALHPELGDVEGWNESVYDEASGILTYWNSYRVIGTDKIVSAEARIRYTPQAGIAAMIEDAGLVVDRWLGDWQGGAFDPLAREIIPIGRLA